MSTYNIDFTDPLKPGFTIAPGGFNGPGGANADTTLRLYGRGALEWGEAVDEDIARLAENFAGATPPLSAIFGQIWLEQKLYIQNTLIVLIAGANAPVNAFHRYRFEDDAWYTSGEAPYPFEVFVTAGTIVAYGNGITIGESVFSVADDVLYRWDSPYKQATPQWMPRSRTKGTANPVDGTTKPKQTLLMWQPSTAAGGGEWSGPSVTTVASTVDQPVDPSVGMLWWNTDTGTLNVWDGVAWQAVLITGAAATGDLNMGGFNITGLPVLSFPEASSEDAATIRYVNEAVSSSNLSTTLDPIYLRKDGVGATMTGGFLTLFQAPTLALHAATMGYVDTEITNLGIGAGGSAVAAYTGGAPTYKAGDIFTNGTIIWISVAAGVGAPPGGSWKQVFPAQYS